jgi:hypothetical protein
MPQRRHVIGQLLDRFFKRHEYPRLIVLGGAAHEKFHRQQGLAAARAPQTSVGRPAGNPPPVISSSPRMPVGDFRKVLGAIIAFVFILIFPADSFLYLHKISQISRGNGFFDVQRAWIAMSSTGWMTGK